MFSEAITAHEMQKSEENAAIWKVQLPGLLVTSAGSVLLHFWTILNALGLSIVMLQHR